MRPLRILHLTAGSDAGGLSQYLLQLCRAMHSEGHEIAIAGERGAWHDRFAAEPWPWIDVPLKGGPFALSNAAKSLQRYLAAHPIDLFHTHYRKATLVARKVQRTSVVPILYTLHLSHISLAWPRRWFSDFGDHTHVAASEARDWLLAERVVPAKNITLIPHGIEIEEFTVPSEQTKLIARAALGLEESDRVALYVGRLDDPKNEGWLLDLAARSRTSMPNLRVLLAGEGPHEEALKSRIQRENLGDRVKLLGHREPMPIYCAADALLLPSAREGFSLACAEAMCAGVPVLRTRTSGTAELIVENVTGVSVPIEREAFISGSMKFMSDLPALRTMGQGAAARIREHFTFERQLSQTLELYERLAAGGRAN